jgi:beta-galactosidase/beta-glucuronidase
MSKKVLLPRPEYPRPQFVRDEWLNLNGIWEFEVVAKHTLPAVDEERKYLSIKKFSKTILVPFCPESELSGIGNKDFMSCVWYRRKFEIPQNWGGKRVLLHFGAVDYDAKVWINPVRNPDGTLNGRDKSENSDNKVSNGVNGNIVGFHRGGYTPFSFEITKYIKAGKNKLVVRAVDDTQSPLQPTGKQSDKLESYGCLYTRTTGIWQTVWLEAVPQTYLQSLKIEPNIKKGTITIHARINGEVKGLKLNTTAFASKKKVGSITVTAANTLEFSLSLSEKKLWEPKRPFLYDLAFEIVKKDEGRRTKDEKTIDLVKSYFGLRKVSVDGKRVFINNKPIFQRLVLDQGFYLDGIYTAPDDIALKQDIELSLALGFNGARLHQKVFEPRFLYWADKLGYLVWGEYPNWGLDHSEPEVLERMRAEWIEAVDRDFNHPSLIGWCPFNETPQNQNPELLRVIYRLTKQLDPTRPVIDTSGYIHVETDIYDVHNYEQNPEKFKATFEPFKKSDKNVWRNLPEKEVAYQGQPYFVSEYGGIWWNPGQKDEKAWGYGDRPKSKKEFITRYRALTETLLNHPKMFGFCYTQLYDIEQEVNGLYTYDRKPKFNPGIIKKINAQLAEIEKNKTCNRKVRRKRSEND